jgi:hypothetical protein
MFSPKLHVIEPQENTVNPAHEAEKRGPRITGEGNPNLIQGGWGFPSDLGMSRADLYPSKHQNAWYTRLAIRWIM